MRKQKEELCQLHDLLVQLRSLNIIEAALHQQEELREQYTGILTKKQQRELEQVAEMVQKMLRIFGCAGRTGQAFQMA